MLPPLRKVPSLAKGPCYHPTKADKVKQESHQVTKTEERQKRSIKASYVAFGICPKIPFYVYAILFTMDSTSRCSPCPSGMSKASVNTVLSPHLSNKSPYPAFININKSSRREGLVYSLLVTAQRPIFIPLEHSIAVGRSQKESQYAY